MTKFRNGNRATDSDLSRFKAFRLKMGRMLQKGSVVYQDTNIKTVELQQRLEKAIKVQDQRLLSAESYLARALIRQKICREKMRKLHQYYLDVVANG